MKSSQARDRRLCTHLTLWTSLASALAVACHPAEPPFKNEYWDNYRDGLYVDAVNGEPLFSSRDKFDPGTGWPSFSQPIEPERVETDSDWSFGVLRIEVQATGSGVHLGHVFGDGPPPTGLRYSVSSGALRFIAAEELGSHGYGTYRALFESAGPAVVNVTVAD